MLASNSSWMRSAIGSCQSGFGLSKPKPLTPSPLNSQWIAMPSRYSTSLGLHEEGEPVEVELEVVLGLLAGVDHGEQVLEAVDVAAGDLEADAGDRRLAGVLDQQLQPLDRRIGHRDVGAALFDVGFAGHGCPSLPSQRSGSRACPLTARALGLRRAV